MQLIDIQKSKTDKVSKFMFLTEDKLLLEASYIDNNTGKDIICISCQSSCANRCKFCHLTEVIGKIKLRNFTEKEIISSISQVSENLKLEEKLEPLVVSFMGCGEPTQNAVEVLNSMYRLNQLFSKKGIRFAVATSIPKKNIDDFFWLTNYIKSFSLPVKMHLSLHYTNNSLRKEWMPNSLEIEPSICALEYYSKFTGNAAEIHYALIEGVNDTKQDAAELCAFLRGRNINVKFIQYNETPGLNNKQSPKENYWYMHAMLTDYGIANEYYIPPGQSLGSSCGAYILENYLKYNIIKQINDVETKK